MIFKRREKPPFWDRVREILVPRKGYWRGVSYVGKRLHRLPDNPHRIALGFACGAMASFTPFFGFHFIVAAIFAWLVRANILAAAFGTIVGNPISFPFIATASLQTGWWITGAGATTRTDGFSLNWLIDNFQAIFLPYLVGGILPGLLTAIVCYLVLGPIVEAFQERRRKKLAAKAAQLRAAVEREHAAYEAHDLKEGDNA